MIITEGSIVQNSTGETYFLDKNIGSGGFGQVYKAHNEQTGELVAVKVLKNTFDREKTFFTFQKELNRATLLDADNVIRYLYVHDGKEFPEYPPFIIMEYSENGTLRDLINQQNGKQFDIDVLKSFYLQLANGMKSISMHLVHRDIKPENILNFNGVLKITDFGLSKISEESTKTLTFKNYGTPLYIAPEAWNCDKNTIQMDIYSMGIVFYELATLSYPYELPANMDYSRLRDMHLYNAPINPLLRNNCLPPNIVSIVIKMLEKPIQKRFKDWNEIITALTNEPLPRDDISRFITKALTLRNEKDLQFQQKQLEKKKIEEERENYIALAYSQYRNTVLSPVQELIDGFNSQYPHGKTITIHESAPSSLTEFSTTINLLSGQRIKITGEILFQEQFVKTVNDFFDSKPKIVHYIPQCKGKDIILWCQVTDGQGLGFNLLLIKNENSLYGDWLILENSVNGLSNIKRMSPFGFKLAELPKEIVYLGATHIYTMELTSFSKEKLLDYIATRI